MKIAANFDLASVPSFPATKCEIDLDWTNTL